MSNPWIFGWDQLFSLVSTIAIVAGASAAWVGLRTWRQEHVERRQCELAEEALSLMYEAKDIYRHVRSPMSYGGEGSSRPPSGNETEEEKRVRDLEYVPFERLRRFEDFFERVIAIRPRYRAIFGRGADEPLSEILNIRHRIHVAVRMLSRLESRKIPDDPEKLKAHMRRVQEWEAVKWCVDEDDPIEEQLDEATAKIESTVEPLLQSRYRL